VFFNNLNGRGAHSPFYKTSQTVTINT